jgi:hypothetical protein
LEILLAWHALKSHMTVYLMSDYEIILYHTGKWRKRLVNKKRKPCRLMVQSDPSSLKLRRTGSSWPQEDPPSLKLPPSLTVLAKAMAVKKLRRDKSARQAAHGEKRQFMETANQQL